MELVKGQTYQNRKGKYKVLEIYGKSMKVRYIDGPEAVLTQSIQKRIIINMQIEQDVKAPIEKAAKSGFKKEEIQCPQ